MGKPLQESIDSLVEATTSTDRDAGLLDVLFLTSGWGSSGYYSRDVVEAAAPLFEAGTQMYLDHPTEEERITRPGRSVRDIAAVIKEAGVYDAEAGGVRGKIKPVGPYREFLLDEDFAKNIGLSILGSASDIVEGEAEGRTGGIIEGLAALDSVDFVSRAGRGGTVLAVLESASPELVNRRAVRHGVAEATADERRTQLSDAVRTAYGSSDRYAWVQDFDDTTVWFQESPENDAARYWQQSYTVADGDMTVSLTGERTEVRQVTRYLPITTDAAANTGTPVTRPGSTTATESEEDRNMSNIEIEESEHTRLTEEAGRVTVLEGERNTAIAERDEARRHGRAVFLLAESDHKFSKLETKGLLSDLPLSEDGTTLDEEKFKTALTEAAAESAEKSGAGSVSGFGGNVHQIGGGDQPTVEESDIDKAVGHTFGRTVKGA